MESFDAFKTRLDGCIANDKGLKEWLRLEGSIASLLGTQRAAHTISVDQTRGAHVSANSLIDTYRVEACAFRTTMNLNRYMAEMHLSELCAKHDTVKLESSFKRECDAYKGFHANAFDEYIRRRNERECDILYGRGWGGEHADADALIPLPPRLPEVLEHKYRLSAFCVSGAIYTGAPDSSCDNCLQNARRYRVRTDVAGVVHEQCGACGHIQKAKDERKWHTGTPSTWLEHSI